MMAPRKLSIHPWMAVLAAALGLVLWTASGQIRHVLGISGMHGAAVADPKSDASSQTGYENGVRGLILPPLGDDGYQWIMQTQMMAAGSGARLHHVEYDNAPRGREAHWASPLRWIFGGLGWAVSVVSGKPFGASVEVAALLAGPLFLGMLLLVAVPIVARRVGAWAGSLLAVGMVASYPFRVYFDAGYPDHHGLLEVCGMLAVLLLLAGGGGWVRREGDGAAGGLPSWLPRRRAARGWFVASGAAGAAGLWISAASQIPVLAGIGIGAVGAAWLGGRQEGAVRDHALWRLWGRVGAACSLAAWLVEYFPGGMGMRLEVNHPLYSLAWLGAGEILARISRLAEVGGAGWRREDSVACAWAGAAAAAPLAVIAAAPVATFRVLDPFVMELGIRYVAEGRSLASYFAATPSAFTLVERCAPALVGLPAALLLLRRRTGGLWRAQIVLALGPALLLALLTFREIRWWGLEIAMLLALLAAVLGALDSLLPTRRAMAGWGAACLLVFAPGMGFAVRGALLSADYTADDVRAMAGRDFAHWLKARAGEDPLVVASTPVTTNRLVFHGGVRGLGTLYWENTEGLRRAGALFAAASADEARALARAYGVTHVVLFSWDPFAGEYARMYRELTGGKAPNGEDFISGILHGRGLPPWLRAVPYRLPAHEALKGQSVFVLEVCDPQTPEEQLVRTAAYLADMGRPELAAKLEPALERVGSLPALVALAYVRARAGEEGSFFAALDRIAADGRGLAGLDLEQSARLAIVQAIGGRAEAAREALGHALLQVDGRSLRRLPSDVLGDFMDLCARNGVAFADPALRELAAELMPPSYRANR